ncbi:MAG: endonuclease III [Candidatus Micrarchaeales archaeon]|nr:endonuclease III [Candidatus Micrarchaeales archaeon]
MKSAKGKINTIISRLKKKYPEELRTRLHYKNPWELLVATMLSAQSQDAQVNKVTPALFGKYPNIKDYLDRRPQDLYPYVRTLGLYRNKSKNIIKAAHYIHDNFDSRLPKHMEQLVQIPGVGRKTANVVQGNAFGVTEGIAIDTHCITVANRLFLFNTKNAEKIEKDMMKFVPKKEWVNATHLLIALGRDVCTARRKYCEDCVLNDICPSSTVKKS